VGKNPTDRGKTGTKRSVLTDGGGVPIGLAVEGANRNDFSMTRETIESIPVKRPQSTPDTPQGMCLAKGDDYEAVRALLAEFGFTAHIRARGEEAKALQQETGFRARRWVVERTPQQVLEGIGRGLPTDLGQLPAVLAIGGTEQPLQISQRPLPRLGALEIGGQAALNIVPVGGPRRDHRPLLVAQARGRFGHPHHDSSFYACSWKHETTAEIYLSL
jgi:hypothetical protein